VVVLIPKKLRRILIVPKVGEVGNDEDNNAEKYEWDFMTKHPNTIPPTNLKFILRYTQDDPERYSS